jgi:hypothetical protein
VQKCHLSVSKTLTGFATESENFVFLVVKRMSGGDDGGLIVASSGI